VNVQVTGHTTPTVGADALPGRISAWWNTFWFAPAPAINLAAARVIFSLHALWMLGSLDLAAISGVPEVFWAGVSRAERWRYLLFPGHASLEYVLQWTTFAALIAAAIGVWPRVACFCAGLLLYHLAPLETIFWTPNPFERGFTIDVLGCSRLVLRWRCLAPAVPARRRPSLERVSVAPSSRSAAALPGLFHRGLREARARRPGWVGGENIGRWMLVFSQRIRSSSPHASESGWPIGPCLLVDWHQQPVAGSRSITMVWPRLQMADPGRPALPGNPADDGNPVSQHPQLLVFVSGGAAPKR
jgi:hypothetical protein